MLRLEKKVALITGAGSGIGRAASLLFASEGARVVVADIASEGGEETVRLIVAAGGNAVFVKTDVTDEASVARAVADGRDAFGDLHILYNNAGGARPLDGSVTDVPLEDVRKTLEVDLLGTVLCCRHAIPVIASAGGGAIVNTASTVAFNGTRKLTGYTAAKGAVVALTRSMAVEYAHLGIRVNAVNPTRTLTDRILRKAEQDPSRNTLAERLLLGYAQPVDVAYAALFLASDEARVTTGHVLAVDSGLAIA